MSNWITAEWNKFKAFCEKEFASSKAEVAALETRVKALETLVTAKAP